MFDTGVVRPDSNALAIDISTDVALALQAGHSHEHSRTVQMTQQLVRRGAVVLVEHRIRHAVQVVGRCISVDQALKNRRDEQARAAPRILQDREQPWRSGPRRIQAAVRRPRYRSRPSCLLTCRRRASSRPCHRIIRRAGRTAPSSCRPRHIPWRCNGRGRDACSRCNPARLGSCTRPTAEASSPA
jgi:hypothetical protein